MKSLALLAGLLLLALAAAPAGAAEDPLAHLTRPGPGWTAFHPSPETRIVYVSSTQGDDANDGLSPEKPLRSIAPGFKMLRNGSPDWLLLKRGDVWREAIGTIGSSSLKCGRSESEPMLIASYGSEGPRPLLKLGDQRAGLSVGVNRPGKMSNLAVVGIHFYDEKGDPASPEFDPARPKGNNGISWLSPGENLLLEDCYFDTLFSAIMGRAPWQGQDDDVMKNVKVRRCVVARAWSSSGHCQGFFFEKVDGLLLEENVLDHNGYCEEAKDLPTVFNHNVYITITCDHVVARGNIVARGSSTGLYCRTNGILEGNLCLDNTPSLNLGRIQPPRPGGITGRICGNVVIGAKPRNDGRNGFSGMGIEVGNVNLEGALVADNILIGTGEETSAALAISPAGVGAHNVTLRDNIVYNWGTAVTWVGTPGTELVKQKLSGIAFRNNVFQVHRPSKDALLSERDMGSTEGFTFEGNTYFTTAPAGEWFRLGRGTPTARLLGFPEWLALAGDKGGKAERIPFPDPARDVASYQRSLGKEATLEAFLAEACRQSKQNWRPEYTAAAAIAYIRAGFDLPR